MAEKEFSIWQGDLLPFISTTLIGSDGTLVNAAAGPVYFRLLKNGVLVFEKLATLNDPDSSTGKVRYEWQPGDTDVAGLFDGQWRGIFDGRPMTFPGPGRFHRVRINRRPLG